MDFTVVVKTMKYCGSLGEGVKYFWIFHVSNNRSQGFD